MSDHRAAVRHHTLRTGIVEFNNGTGSIISVPCTISDVSGTGARLALNSSLWVAEQFSLIFLSGLRKDCRVAWRKGRLIGSAFTEGCASPDEQAVMMTADEQSRHRLGIAARVKAARETRGYTEAQLAERIGVAPAFVSLAENGEADIPLYQLMHIADLLMVSLDGLVAGPAPNAEEFDAA
ncbi:MULTISPECIES: helix-turn-helix transcriptional regulator [unclassified Bradyrhizobium]|uniref:helix-turn-helix domain-containing protein n=1 Tax=unclassified Bradyrhizobium TaxID=2631580 RepID=UPI001FFC1108|nr:MULTISPECIES: helix-turn-helix transcriptional regulator [unclassified Bradyrhizobium]MCK1708276.1 helix-turn-helix transcriptional regulator [Bradyrhizobium sp. 143]MCK1732031.1 helix-turn-helix transcriptional regulator [Bradyrhizobium sp. 142]